MIKIIILIRLDLLKLLKLTLYSKSIHRIENNIQKYYKLNCY